MMVRHTYIILFFSIVLVFSACGRDRRSHVRHSFLDENKTVKTNKNTFHEEDSSNSELWSQKDFDLLAPAMPSHISSQILERLGYITSYNHYTKCPNWVAWHLTDERTNGPYPRKGVPYYDENGSVIGIGHVTPETQRGDYFIDLQAEEPRQEFSDWTDTTVSNNSHGHICPAADCRWSKASMNQSFLLTNMCPQDKDLNGGDWEGLERRCRGWAKHYGEIFIVAGPVFYNGVKTTMGANKVGVPDAFFKVVLCLEREPKAIGFIFPNNAIHHELEEYVKSVDEVEDILGYDFFHNLPDDIETKIESTSNLKQW